jgi:hypothetical protein
VLPKSISKNWTKKGKLGGQGAHNIEEVGGNEYFGVGVTHLLQGAGQETRRSGGAHNIEEVGRQRNAHSVGVTRLSARTGQKWGF